MSRTALRQRAAVPLSGAYVPEIQGLRTIALLLVATYHVWFDRVSGGVDVFLLISAYLMTRSLAARGERGQRTKPAAFLLRKFSRLLPAAAAAVALTLAAVYFLYPPSTWTEHAREAVASVAYFENLHLQRVGTDYFAANDAMSSPFQHFWSLSVQGQVFVMWALMHAASEWFARATGVRVRRVLLVVFSTVLVASFVWAVVYTGIDQALAYFDTPARMWEFAAGSLLALVKPSIRLPDPARVVAGWLGLVGLVSCGWVLPIELSFPGWAALWPVVSAALVILAAGEPTRFGADRLLALPILGRLGGYTYALYLVHWPVLITFIVVRGTVHPDALEGALVLAMSMLVTIAVVHLVERPVDRFLKRTRSSAGNGPAAADAAKRTPPAEADAPGDSASEPIRPRRRAGLPSLVRPTAVIAVTLAVGVGGAQLLTFASAHEQDRVEAALANADYAHLGANAGPGAQTAGDPIPDLAGVKTNWVRPGAVCPEGVPYWTQGCFIAPAVDDDGEPRVVFTFGNSHTNQFAGTLLETVSRHGSWTLRTQFAPACTLEAAASDEPGRERCRALWETAEEYIAAEQPDMVVLIATLALHDGEQAIEGLPEWIAEMRELAPSTVFVAVRDNPRLDRDLGTCIIDHGYQEPDCVGRYVRTDPAGIRADLEAAGALWVDLTDSICDGRECAPVRGGVVTYLDDNHLTRAYVRTLAQAFADQVSPSVDWWPADGYAGEFVDRTDRELDMLDILNE